MKRKSGQQLSALPKKQKLCEADKSPARQARVLASCYPSVLSLRQYFIARLPVKSSRRKRFKTSFDGDVDAILDNWKVGVLAKPAPEIKRARSTELAAFTQTQARGTDNHTVGTQTCSLDEVVNFAIWYLFNKASTSFTRPRHLLCSGLQRGVAPDGANIVPGVAQVHPNDNLRILKCPSWYHIFAALGANGDVILSSLLLDCGLFLKLESGKDNYYQVSGIPITDLASPHKPSGVNAGDGNRLIRFSRAASAIHFVRSRLLYAKPPLNKKSQVRFGLKHIHVLQRCSNVDDKRETIHILKYIFPRQFSLHNVFTSPVDKRQTSQAFPDYIYREDEIAASTKHPKQWLPRRLRGNVLRLISQIRKRHSRCSYSQLLRHYCPLQPRSKLTADESRARVSQKFTLSSGLVSQISYNEPNYSGARRNPPGPNPEHSFLAHATDAVSVSAFCRAVLWAILPSKSFGEGDDGRHNWSHVLRQIDSFVKMRRFEPMSLHQICQGLRLKCITWLVPESMTIDTKLSRSERDKRLEILHEFLYYLFDSLLIPLIQSNFYVTESGPQRNRLFFFRHDVWRKMAEPGFAMVRSGIYQQLKPTEVRRLLNSRTLGYSHVRLLPKEEGTRTITNLKRRITRTVHGKRVLGPSINAQLAPVFSTLTYERLRDPGRLGSAIFSVGGFYEKLKQFKTSVHSGARLYFAKVDVQSCFDSIPQDNLLYMMQAVIRRSSYRTTKYAETKPARGDQIRHRWLNLARPASEEPVFSKNSAEDLASVKVGRVFADTGSHKVWSHQDLLALLREHVQNNVVKIGKKHLRQKEGIPQGSVLSSILCSFFYTAFEIDQLSFIDARNSLLIRLIDDFLLVTTDKNSARMFLEVMTRPHSDYGIAVNPQKTLANFEVVIGSHKIPRHQSTDWFPYCGMTINTTNLQVGKDRQRKDCIINNGLTVDTTRRGGSTFHRKVRLSFVQQMHRMVLDGSLNSAEQILSTLLEAYSETVMKMHSYSRCMPQHQRPSEGHITQIAKELLKLGTNYVSRRQPGVGARPSDKLTKKQVAWALSTAFEGVLGHKQSQYGTLLRHLRAVKQSTEVGMGMSRKTLSKLIERRNVVFRDYVY